MRRDDTLFVRHLKAIQDRGRVAKGVPVAGGAHEEGDDGGHIDEAASLGEQLSPRQIQGRLSGFGPERNGFRSVVRNSIVF